MTYQELVNRIVQLQEEGLELFNAGKSTLGKNILATHVGSYDGVQILIQGGIHAREYISTLLMVEQARELYLTDSVKDGGIYFVFLTNPDGAEIVLDGLDSVTCEITRNYLRSANGGSDNFNLFKANINLVDLNTNFNANWGQGAQNVRCPATEDFIGFYPVSERETKSLVDFTLQTRPLLTISYHSKGNVIYYGFEGESEENIRRDQSIGEALSEATGYPLIFTENSTGGYKDWCINTLTIPAYTIEIGDESLDHPLGEEALPEIYARNKNVPLIALQKAIEFSNSIDFNAPILQNVTKEKRNETKNNRSNATSYRTRILSLLERRDSCRCSNCKKWQDNF